MSVGVPGGYRFMSWRPRYSPDLVEALLPTVWGFPIAGVSERGPVDCRQGSERTCEHVCELDQWDEGCVVDGDYRDCAHRHGGHSQCGKCLCVDPTHRRSSDNRESDVASMRIDIAVAWHRTPLSEPIRDALFYRAALAMTEQEVADVEGVSKMAISLRLKAGYGQLADYLNGRST